MNIIKKILKRTILSIVAFYVFMLGMGIYHFPDYKGHRAIYQYSKDKQYKGILVSPNKDEWEQITILVRASDNEILGFGQISKDTLDIRGAWFNYCYEEGRDNKMCFEPGDSKDAIPLPPSLLARLKAWLIVKIRGFKVPKLPEKEWRRY